MKMTYLRTNKNNFGLRSSILTILIICLVAIVILIQYLKPQIFPTLFSSIATPFWRIEFAVESGALLSNNRLLDQNESLRRQLTEAEVRLLSIKSVEDENIELKSLMNRSSTTPQTLAAVLARPPLSTYDVIIIDLGINDDISTSSRVYGLGNIPIGQIFEINKNTSKVLLFSSPGQKYEVFVGPNNTPATAIGRGGGQYEAEVSRGANIIEGDSITIPSINSRPIGKITTVESNPSEMFETILFAPPINIFNLKWVLVDKK